jgi:rubrerythrin
LDIEVQVVAGSSSPHLPHSPHVGLDRHIEDNSHDNEITKKQQQVYNNSKEIEKERRNIISSEEYTDIQLSQHVAEAAKVAEAVTQESTAIKGQKAERQQVLESIYRIEHSDNWACKSCRQKGDKWFMQQHICRGRK